MRCTAAGWASQHRLGIERVDPEFARHVLAPIEQANDCHVVPDAVVGKGEFAPRAVLAASVGHVVGMAVEEKMVRVDAAALVAAMADIDMRRDRAMPDRPGEAMRPLGAAIHGERAVAGIGHGAAPDVAA